jgi:hypothetical protein
VKQTRSKDYEVNQGLFREKVEAPHIFIWNFWVHFLANYMEWKITK